jgi:hypothetical protein
MEDSRACAQCGTVFEPRREHARFCSSLYRVIWNRWPSCPAGRKSLEGTFAGFRFVHNTMSYYVDPSDFIEPQPGSRGGDAPVSEWAWRTVGAPASVSTSHRSSTLVGVSFMTFELLALG